MLDAFFNHNHLKLVKQPYFINNILSKINTSARSKKYVNYIFIALQYNANI